MVFIAFCCKSIEIGCKDNKKKWNMQEDSAF